MAETSVWADMGQRDMTLLYNLRFWSLTLLRVFLGGLFAYHGALRLLVPANLAGSISYFAQVGIPFAQPSAYIFGIVEVVAGMLLLVGVFTRWSAFVLMLEMIYIFFKVHLKGGFLVGNNGYEFVLLLIFALLFVLVNGPGHLALEKMLEEE
ncbi:MAG TPA: DoxX family protein [Candidatus Nanoarchaeia archaeon]|nr:DoxX family protein [Candidatus Nanoarchaeia archaeon]